MERPDPHKVFLGSLQPQINKPQLQQLCEDMVLSPVDIIVPQVKAGKLAIAFCTFSSEQEALRAVHVLQGYGDNKYTPAQIHAHRGGPSWESLSGFSSKLIFRFCLIFWTLGTF